MCAIKVLLDVLYKGKKKAAVVYGRDARKSKRNEKRSFDIYRTRNQGNHKARRDGTWTLI